MIFTLQELHSPRHIKAVALVVDINHRLVDSDPFVMYDMLKSAFPNIQCRVGCYNGYENCVIIERWL